MLRFVADEKLNNHIVRRLSPSQFTVGGQRQTFI